MRFSGFFHRQESILSDNASEVSCERMKKIVEAIRNIQKLNNHLESELDRLKTRKKKETRGGKFVFPHLPKFLIRYLFPLCCAWQVRTKHLCLWLAKKTSPRFLFLRQ